MTGAVYVVAAPNGHRKVGFSIRPQSRLARIQQGRGSVDGEALFWCDRGDLRALEAVAHRILRDRHIKGEWFDVSAAEAVQAVVDAARQLGLEIAPAPFPARRSRAARENGGNAPWQRRAREAGLTQKTLARLLGHAEITVSRQLRGHWTVGVPKHVRAAIVAWELMSEEQRAAWLEAMGAAAPQPSEK